MKTTAEKIAVMQAHRAGKDIQYYGNKARWWEATSNPGWDWLRTDYRVAPEVRETFQYGDRVMDGGKEYIVAATEIAGAVLISIETGLRSSDLMELCSDAAGIPQFIWPPYLSHRHPRHKEVQYK
mgnify:CR=1 FL=1